MRFVIRMAMREVRASWRRLVFFFICIAVGVGSIVALRSVIQSVRVALAGEARTMLGADVLVTSNRPLSQMPARGARRPRRRGEHHPRRPPVPPVRSVRRRRRAGPTSRACGWRGDRRFARLALRLRRPSPAGPPRVGRARTLRCRRSLLAPGRRSAHDGDAHSGGAVRALPAGVAATVAAGDRRRRPHRPRESCRAGRVARRGPPRAGDVRRIDRSRCCGPALAADHAVQVVDPIGAGDAYVAGFLWATLQGRSLQDTVDTAAAVAALKCSTWGDIALVSPRDVEDVLAGGPDVRR